MTAYSPPHIPCWSCGKGGADYPLAKGRCPNGEYCSVRHLPPMMYERPSTKKRDEQGDQSK